MKTRYKSLGLAAFIAFSVLVFVAAAFIGVSKLADKSRQMVDLKLQSKIADDQLTSLATAKKQVQKYSYFNDVAKTVIPNDKDQAQAVLDISQMANASGITLQNINFPASNLGVRSSSASASSAPTGGAAGGSTALSQAKSVPGIAGLYSLQVTVSPQTGQKVPPSQTSTYVKFIDFLNRIEHDRRTAQITQIDVSPQPDGSLDFTLTINIFIKP